LNLKKIGHIYVEAQKLVANQNTFYTKEIYLMKSLTLNKKTMHDRLNQAKAIVMGAAMALANPSVYATSINSVNISENANADQLVGMLGGIVLQIAKYGGIVLMLWGAVMFGFAVKSDEPESKQKALMTAIAGFILFSLRWLLTQAGIVTA